ncbi:hypothetical protein [Naasia sp. SYSU D00057]|uniref:hypothetical protein n=1 Tax=Naasia sp. SYSU D00057 TaxID=2817380 RepID=UPI001B301520|nr:hypothetical protein [Naasia sp. SYSU D00057]
MLRLLLCALALSGAWALAAMILGSTAATASENPTADTDSGAILAVPVVEDALVPALDATTGAVPLVADALAAGDALGSVEAVADAVPAVVQPVVAAVPPVEHLLDETVPAVLTDVRDLPTEVLPTPLPLPAQPSSPSVPSAGGGMTAASAPEAAPNTSTVPEAAAALSVVDGPVRPAPAAGSAAAPAPVAVAVPTSAPLNESPVAPLTEGAPAPTQGAGQSTPQPALHAALPPTLPPALAGAAIRFRSVATVLPDPAGDLSSSPD